MTKPTGKEPLGRLRRRWENNINIDSKEIGIDAMDSTHLAQDRNMWGGGGCFERGTKPLGSTKCSELLNWHLDKDCVPCSWLGS